MFAEDSPDWGTSNVAVEHPRTKRGPMIYRDTNASGAIANNCSNTDDFETDNGRFQKVPLLKERSEKLEDVDDEKNFMATKPWLGAIYPPSCYIRNQKDPHDVMDENFNNWSEPVVDLELDYVFGYKAKDSRYNLHWVDTNTVVFPAAAVGIVFDIKTQNEKFFFGHNDEIMCLDFHKESGLVASGSIGAEYSCRLCIWEVATLQQRQVISGSLQFGVMSVNFNKSASLVCALGFDDHHSVAIFSVATGQLLAISPADKNRVLHCRFTRCEMYNGESSFVTIGVSHVCFWDPVQPDANGKTFYEVTDLPTDRRLTWQRGNKIDDIDHICILGLDFTRQYAVVSATNGTFYLFDPVQKVCVHSVAAGAEANLNQVIVLESEATPTTDTIVCGGRSGEISFWKVQWDAKTSNVGVFADPTMTADGSTTIDMNKLDAATDNDSETTTNAIRSLSWNAQNRQLVCGTFLTAVYTIDVQKVTAKGSSDQWASTLIGGHWGNLKDPEFYGEVWGVDTHPSKPWFVSCAEDCTIRVWELENCRELHRRYLPSRAHTCCFSLDGLYAAVGFKNGGFMVLTADLSQAIVPFTRERKREVMRISFSPNGLYLALVAEMAIDVYAIVPETAAAADSQPILPTEPKGTGSSRKMKCEKVGTCLGHTSYITTFDWSLQSDLLQSTSNGYELLYHAIPDCCMMTGAKAIADQLWYTQTCELGWCVQGIWPRYADGSDINSVSKSHSEKWLITTDDWGRVNLFNFPCLGSGLDRKTGKLRVRPQSKVHGGHSSHVTNSAWTFDDSFVVTTGGADLSIFSWRVKYNGAEKPKHFLNAEKAGKLKPSRHGVRASETPQQDDLGLTAELPTNCYMCEFPFDNAEAKTCPRCNAPRTKPGAKLRKAWTGKAESRFRLPTQSFARYSKMSQSQRSQVESTVKPDAVWKGGTVKVGMTKDVGSDSDEEAIAAKLRNTMALQLAAQKKPDVVDNPKPKTKKTAGPSFDDL
jgi:microtubule-associated protein-like 6